MPDKIHAARPIPISKEAHETIHENLSLLLTVAFSTRSLYALFESKLQTGTLSDLQAVHLRHDVYERPVRNSVRACTELAVTLRAIDDKRNLSDVAAQQGKTFGTLIVSDETTMPLAFRDVCNKIIHADLITWTLSEPMRPIINARAGVGEDWKKAEIDLVELALFVGHLF